MEAYEQNYTPTKRTVLECSPKTGPEVMRRSGAERRRNSHEKEKTYTGRNHQKAA
jgi:hypothetical protein